MCTHILYVCIYLLLKDIFFYLLIIDSVSLSVFLSRRPSRRATAPGVLPQGILERPTMRMASPKTALPVCRSVTDSQVYN